MEDNRGGAMITTAYELTAEVWRSDSPSDRFFVTLPEELARELRGRFGGSHQAVGSLPVSVGLGRSVWSTSLYADQDTTSFVIPIRADIRMRERVREGQVVSMRFAVKRPLRSPGA